jgi:hypothetical protein
LGKVFERKDGDDRGELHALTARPLRKEIVTIFIKKNREKIMNDESCSRARDYDPSAVVLFIQLANPTAQSW